MALKAQPGRADNWTMRETTLREHLGIVGPVTTLTDADLLDTRIAAEDARDRRWHDLQRDIAQATDIQGSMAQTWTLPLGREARR